MRLGRPGLCLDRVERVEARDACTWGAKKPLAGAGRALLTSDVVKLRGASKNQTLVAPESQDLNEDCIKARDIHSKVEMSMGSSWLAGPNKISTLQ